MRAIEPNRGFSHQVPGPGSEILLQRTLCDDARSAIGKDSGDYHLVTIGVVISKLDISTPSFLVVICMDQAERHFSPHSSANVRRARRD